MNRQTQLAIFAILAALGLAGIVVFDAMMTAQEISAAKPPTQGCRNSQAVNASQARCFHG
jgi:hypothetical protein